MSFRVYQIGITMGMLCCIVVGCAESHEPISQVESSQESTQVANAKDKYTLFQLVRMEQLKWQPLQGQGWQAQSPGRTWTARMDRQATMHMEDRQKRWSLRVQLAEVDRQHSTTGVTLQSPTFASQDDHIMIQHQGVSQWYGHHEGGLRHGLMIQERPDGRGDLLISLDVDGGAVEQMGPDQIGVTTVTGHQLHYQRLRVWDAQHRPIPAQLHAYANNQIQLQIDDAHAQYPLTVDPDWLEKPGALTMDFTGKHSQFGDAITVDGNVMVIGAPNAPVDNAPDVGLAYVYAFDSNNGWQMVAQLHNPRPSSGDLFGSSVAVDNTNNLIAVSAPGEESKGPQAGLVYVFKRVDGHWTNTSVEISSVNTNDNDLFGSAIALDTGRLVIGAPNEDTTDNNTGAVYVFTYDGMGSWVETQRLSGFGIADDDQLGHSVAIDGNFIIAGAPFADGGKGLAKIYQYSNGSWLEGAPPLGSPDLTSGDQFGHSVAIDQSAGRAMVGAPATVSNGPGTVYSYEVMGGMWTNETSFQASPTITGERFGSSLSFNNNKLAIGAASTTNAGVYLFELNGANQWVQSQRMEPSSPKIGDGLGKSIFFDGAQIFVGAPNRDDVESDVGAVLIFKSLSGAWRDVRSLIQSDVYGGIQFGHSIAIWGDDAAVGAPQYLSDAGNVGAVFMFHKDASGKWLFSQKLLADNVDVGAQFGFSVAMTLDRLAVGSPGFDGNVTDSGAVYTFERVASGVWVPKGPAITPATRYAGEKFGYSVEMDSNYLIAGAPAYNGNEGRAILFVDTGTWNEKTVLGTGTGTSEFGFDVSISGSFIAIGAPKSANGTVYLYDNTSNANMWTANLNTPQIQGASASDLFGWAVDLRNDVLVIGAPGHKPDNSVSGAAYVYHLVHNTWGASQKLFNTNNSADGDRFGDAVDTDAYQLVVGAPRYKTNNEGSAFIYKRTPSNMWNFNNSVNASSGTDGHFGQSVAIKGIYTMVGVPGFNSSKYTDEGRGHFFKRDNTVPVVPAMVNSITATVGQPIPFTVGTSDPDGDPLFYTAIASNGVVTGTHPNFMYKALAGPMDGIQVTVSDGFESSHWTIPVNVNNPPTATNKNITTNEDVSVSDNMDGGDFDGNPLTYNIETIPINGMVTFDNMTGNFTYTPNPDFFGSDTFTFKVNDGLVDSNVATINITINSVDDPPTATGESVILNEDTSIPIFLKGSDPENDPLTFFQDMPPAHGSVIINQLTGVATYTPNANYNGSDSFSFTVQANGQSSTAAAVNLTINAVNDLPVAQDTTATTDEDTSVMIDLTSLGTDIDGDSLQYRIISGPSQGVVSPLVNGAFTYTPNSDFHGVDAIRFVANDGTGDSNSATVTITINSINDIPTAISMSLDIDEDEPITSSLVAQDLDSNTITYALLNLPTKGTVALTNANTGQFIYTPNANENGIDTFTFTASDMAGTSAPATVTINIQAVDDPPTAQPVSVTGLEDAAIPGQLLGADIDSASITYVKKSDPTHGSLSFNANTGGFSYQGNPNFHGTDSFEYEVTADNLTSQVATVTINVNPVNDAPIGSPSMENGTEDTPITASIPIVDPDGDTLSYSLGIMPSHGAVIIDANAGTFTYTPNQDYFGTDSFAIKATDGSLEATPLAEITVTIAPVNDRPVAFDANSMGVKNMPLSAMLMASDVDGDQLTFEVERLPLHGQVTITDPLAGTFQYTPNANFSGQDSFTFVVDDGQNMLNKSLPATVIINVADTNDPPVAQNLTESVEEDTPLMASLSGNDPDGNPLTFTIVTSPTNGTLSGPDVNTGAFTYTPNQDFFGTDNFTFTVNDGIVDSAPATALITITPVNDAPVRGTDSVSGNGTTGQPIMISFTATDVDNNESTLTARALMMPANGTATFNGLNMVYTANSDFSGQEVFDVVFSDGIADSEPTRVTLDIAPKTPDMVVVTEPVEDMVLGESPTTISIEGGAPNETLRVIIVDRFGEPVFGSREAQEVMTDAQGNATYTLPAPLPLDSYTITILRGEDEVAQSAFSINTAGITMPTPVGDVVVENGVIIQPDGEVFVLEGDAPAGSVVVIKDQDGKTIAETIANKQGRWTIKLPAKLGTGILDFIVEITTPDGKKATVRLRIRASDWSPLPFDRVNCQHTPGQPPSAMWLFGGCMVVGLLTYRRRRKRT